MKLHFRVNYRTVMGQSLSLKLGLMIDGERAHIQQVLPMRWLNDRQWALEFEVTGTGKMQVLYQYQFHQEPDGLLLEEWGAPREFELDLEAGGAWVQMDDWRSAGAWDALGATKPFDHFRPLARAGSGVVSISGNHRFLLNMAWVPEGCVPCLLGSSVALGQWDPTRAMCLEPLGEGAWGRAVDLDAGAAEYKYGLWHVADGKWVDLEVGENRVLSVDRFALGDQVVLNDEAYHYDEATLYRGAGVAIPVFSLRSQDGMGVGEFADLKSLGSWAKQAGLSLVQILPVHDTTSAKDWTDSYPYSAISVASLHPLYLRLQDLPWQMPAEFSEMIEQISQRLNALSEVDYEQVMGAKISLTWEVFSRHQKEIVSSAAYREFVQENHEWLYGYAAFCVLRDQFGTADHTQWEDWARDAAACVQAFLEGKHPHESRFVYYAWLQFELDRQFTDAVAHLRGMGVALKGDLPIGIDRCSADAWSEPRYFQMDQQAGAPPDAFAVKGQNWGFPTYDWQEMKQDGYRWWCDRLRRLSRYFDAYRIDHILGFFRIWQIPYEQVEGIMGWFDPALPIHLDECLQRGLEFDLKRFCQPYLREENLAERLGEFEDEVRERYLVRLRGGRYGLRDEVKTQRQIAECMACRVQDAPEDEARLLRLRQVLFDCVSDVLFFEVPGSEGKWFHPRYGMQETYSYRALGHDAKWRVEELYIDYFYRKQEGLWQARGFETLQVLRGASRMLLCGEDLGMVPACVGGVLRELGMLSLEIQRMPKMAGSRFVEMAKVPYRSVVSSSTHDMDPLREWWQQEPDSARSFALELLGELTTSPALEPETAEKILRLQLASPAMWAVFPLQDLLAMSASLRRQPVGEERINIPAIIPYQWRYRMHLTLDDLVRDVAFTDRVRDCVKMAHRLS